MTPNFDPPPLLNSPSKHHPSTPAGLLRVWAVTAGAGHVRACEARQSGSRLSQTPLEGCPFFLDILFAQVSGPSPAPTQQAPGQPSLAQRPGVGSFQTLEPGLKSLAS